MNAELERTWRDLVAEQVEQKRRAELFPELVKALDTALTWPLDRPSHAAGIALLVRCRKP